MRCAISQSTLPVGSSARITSGLSMTARATARALTLAARQFGGKRVDAVAQIDPFEQRRDVLGPVIGLDAAQRQRQRDVVDQRQMVEKPAVLKCTTPIRRRMSAIAFRLRGETRLPKWRTVPAVGMRSIAQRRRNVVFPDPEGPTRNWNEPRVRARARRPRIPASGRG